MKLLFFLLISVLLFRIPALADDTPGTVAAALSDITQSVAHRYSAQDDHGHSMDCLEICQTPSGAFLGVYHVYQDGHFSVHLARSTDLLSWTEITPLDSDASQATIWADPNGSFLVAYEKAVPNSVWIRVRAYDGLTQLEQGTFRREIDLPRSLAPTAEGTPSFESVKMTQGSLDHSTIALRFHFYRNGDVDRAARGTLSNFHDWKAQADTPVIDAFEKLGVKGNLGDRTKFLWGTQHFYLHEAQFIKGDWHSWHIYLCDAHLLPLQALTFHTTGGSQSFSNPAAVRVRLDGQTRLVMTLFVPSEGSAPGEAGELIAVFPCP